ncbi:MAG: hypothetical protein ACOXZ5_02310 [Syntrophomonadaceae bacterium]|jgi:stage III sporulation protein AB
MFLKTIGIAFIIAGFGGWGLLGASRSENRVRQLRNLRMAILFLEKEVTYMYTPLSAALGKTARFTDKPIYYLFEVSSLRLKEKQGVTAAEAWMEGLRYMAKFSDLQKADIELLARLASQLGMSDADEQKKIFKLVQEEIKIQEEKAVLTSESTRRLWSYGGFILGALVVLLLL